MPQWKPVTGYERGMMCMAKNCNKVAAFWSPWYKHDGTGHRAACSAQHMSAEWVDEIQRAYRRANDAVTAMYAPPTQGVAERGSGRFTSLRRRIARLIYPHDCLND